MQPLEIDGRACRRPVRLPVFRFLGGIVLFALFCGVLLHVRQLEADVRDLKNAQAAWQAQSRPLPAQKQMWGASTPDIAVPATLVVQAGRASFPIVMATEFDHAEEVFLHSVERAADHGGLAGAEHIDVDVAVESRFVYSFKATVPQVGILTIARVGLESPLLVTVPRGSLNHSQLEINRIRSDSDSYYISPANDNCPSSCISCPRMTNGYNPLSRFVFEFKCLLKMPDDVKRRGKTSWQDFVSSSLPGYTCRKKHKSLKSRSLLSVYCSEPVLYIAMIDLSKDAPNTWSLFEASEGTRRRKAVSMLNRGKAHPDMPTVYSGVSPKGFANFVIREHQARREFGVSFHDGDCYGSESPDALPSFCKAKGYAAVENYTMPEDRAGSGGWRIQLAPHSRRGADRLVALVLLSAIHNLHHRGVDVPLFRSATADDANVLDPEARCGLLPKEPAQPPYTPIRAPCVAWWQASHSGCKCNGAAQTTNGERRAWCYVDTCEDCPVGDNGTRSCAYGSMNRPWIQCYGDGYAANRPIDGVCPTKHECTGQPYRGMKDLHLVDVTKTLGKPIKGKTTRVFNPMLGTYTREFTEQPVEYRWCLPLGRYSRLLYSGLYVPGEQTFDYRHDISIKESTFGLSTDLYFAHGVQDFHFKFDVQAYSAFDCSYIDGMLWFDMLQPYGGRESFPLSFGIISLQRRFKTCLDSGTIGALGRVSMVGGALSKFMTFKFCVAFMEDRRIFLTMSILMFGVQVVGTEIHLATLLTRQNKQDEEVLAGVKAGLLEPMLFNETKLMLERRKRSTWELAKEIVQLSREQRFLAARVDDINETIVKANKLVRPA